MKKNLLVLVSLLLATTSVFAVSIPKCLLQHGGTVQIFDSDKIANAITSAVDGDTIFLTAGTFPGFTINKKITVRGAGQDTKITSDISISISGTPTLTQTVLEGVDLNSNSKSVTLSSAMKGVKIKQCSMYKLSVDANNTDAIIDRCYISFELCQSTYIKSMTVLNSDVTIGRSCYSTNNTISFVNCNVLMYYFDKCAGTFINSAMTYYTWKGTSRLYNCSFTNCLFKWADTFAPLDGTSTGQGCYYDSSCSWDAATFEELGYLGNDGRVVGYMGGTTPYTLELAVPKVTKSQIVLDSDARVLNVNLKVSAQ